MDKNFYVIIKKDCIELWFDDHKGERVWQSTYHFYNEHYVAKYVFDDIYHAKELGYKIVQIYELD